MGGIMARRWDGSAGTAVRESGMGLKGQLMCLDSEDHSTALGSGNEEDVRHSNMREMFKNKYSYCTF